MPHFIHFPWSWDMLSVGLKVKHYFNSVSHIHTERESERVKYNRFYTFIHTRTFEHLPVEWLWWTGWMGAGCVHKSKGISWMYVVSVCVCVLACMWMWLLDGCGQKTCFLSTWDCCVDDFSRIHFVRVEDESSDVHRFRWKQ